MGLPNGGKRGRGNRRGSNAPSRATGGRNRSEIGAQRRPRAAWILPLALGVVAALILSAGAYQIQRHVSIQRLPPLPDLSAQPKAVAEHLIARFDAARADPKDDRAVGALCVAY